MKYFLVFVVCFLIVFAQGDPVLFSDYFTFTANLGSYFTEDFDNLSEAPLYTSSGNGFVTIIANMPLGMTSSSDISSMCGSIAFRTFAQDLGIIITPESGSPTAFGGWFSCVDVNNNVFDCAISIAVNGNTFNIATTNSVPLFWGIALPTTLTSIQISSSDPSYFLTINYMTVGIYSANGGTGILPPCATAVSATPGTTTTTTLITTTTTPTTTTTSTTSGITTTTSGSTTTTSTSGGTVSPKPAPYCYNLTATVSKALQGTPQYFTFQDFGCNTTDWNIVSVNTTTLYSYQDPNQIKLSIQPSMSGLRPVHYQIMSSNNQYTHTVVTQITIVNHKPVASDVTFTWNSPRNTQTFPNWNLLINCTDPDGDNLSVVQILKMDAAAANNVVQLNSTVLYFIPEKVVLSVLPTGSISLFAPNINTSPVTAGSPLNLSWNKDLRFQYQITDSDVTNQYAWSSASINSI